MTYPQLSSSSLAQDGAQEPDELTRFRDDWKHEVELHRAEVTHETTDGLPSAQHYSAEELPQAQESFVSFQHRTAFFCFLYAEVSVQTTIVDLLFGLHLSEDTHDSSGIPKSVISKIAQGFPQPLTFEPEEETEPVEITRIPDEVLVYILRFLDHGSIERFASISRKARVLTLDSTIWR